MRRLPHRLALLPLAVGALLGCDDLSARCDAEGLCVVESVEDASTEARLREAGCDLAQGYLYSKPLTSQELIDLVRSRQEF